MRVGGVAQMVIGGVDDPMWKVQWSGNRLTLRNLHGSVFSVR